MDKEEFAHQLIALSENVELLEIARKHIEDTLITMRDSRISVLRNNGLVCREIDGSDSSIIRITTEHAIRMGLKTMAEYILSTDYRMDNV